MAAYAKLATVLAVLALLQASHCAAGETFELLPGGGMCHSHRQQHGKHGVPRHGGTPAVMTVNGFARGENGGGPSACDGRFHGDGEMVVALSTRWFEGGRRCHARIRVTSARGDGRSAVATVVDECDSRRGCRDNVVDSSPAVWRALGLDTHVGVVRVTWSDA